MVGRGIYAAVLEINTSSTGSALGWLQDLEPELPMMWRRFPV